MTTGQRNIVPIRTETSTGSSSKAPDWLAGWDPTLPVPVDMTAVQTATASALAALAPATAKEIAVVLKHIAGFLVAFGLMPIENREAVIDAYRQAIEAVPRDLLPDVVRGATIGLRYSRLPLPADLIEPVRDEMARRRLAALRLMTAEIISARQK